MSSRARSLTATFIKALLAAMPELKGARMVRSTDGSVIAKEGKLKGPYSSHVVKLGGKPWALLEVFPGPLPRERDRIIAGWSSFLGTALGQEKELLESFLSLESMERRRLAVELHDTFAQSLSYITLKLGELSLDTEHRELAGLRDAAQAAGDELRRALGVLTRDEGEAGLAGIIRAEVGRFEDKSGVKATWRLDGPEPGLERARLHGVARILREALNNVDKHADSSRVTVSAAVSPGSLTLTVEDDGRGFTDPGEKGFGLRGMGYWAEIIGGRLEIESSAGAGTRVTLFLPLPGV